MKHSAAPTVHDALARFRQLNGIPADEGSRALWKCRLGRVSILLPNCGWRRRAVLAHDLHHLFTGYPCTMRGEFQMAAWEFGAGRMPHQAARLFCLPLVLAGFIWSPRSVWQAFLKGRGSSSLHARTEIGTLLNLPLNEARSTLVAPFDPNERSRNRMQFVRLLCDAAIVTLGPVAALWVLLAAL